MPLVQPGRLPVREFAASPSRTGPSQLLRLDMFDTGFLTRSISDYEDDLIAEDLRRFDESSSLESNLSFGLCDHGRRHEVDCSKCES